MTIVQVNDRSPSVDRSEKTWSTSREAVNSAIIRISILTLLKGPKNQPKQKQHLPSTPLFPTSTLPLRWRQVQKSHYTVAVDVERAAKRREAAGLEERIITRERP
jgi:hypothetical protein